MSIRVDSSQWIVGAIVVGNPGLGVRAETIPTTGDHGPGYLFPSLEFPEDTGREVAGRIVRWPSAGALTVYEDSSFEFVGTEDSFDFQVYVDGIAAGAPQTATIQILSEEASSGPAQPPSPHQALRSANF